MICGSVAFRSTTCLEHGSPCRRGCIAYRDRDRDHDTVIIAGREQPPALGVEAQARALFGDDHTTPLDLPGEYVTRNGHHAHPDPRCQAILEQCRERETEQAVARLRLVHRTEPARVILLSNLPVALPVDHRVSWGGIMPSKAETATAEAAGIELLSASEMARVYPERWPTKAAAKQWRARNQRVTFSHNIYLMEKRYPLAGRVVAYRLHGQYRSGHPHRAWIPAEHGGSLFEAADALAAVVGDVAVIEWADRDDLAE